MKNRAVPILILANKSDLDNAVPCHQVKFFGRSGKNGRHGAKTFWNSSSTSPPTFGQKRVPSLKPYRGREPFLSFEKKKTFPNSFQRIRWTRRMTAAPYLVYPYSPPSAVKKSMAPAFSLVPGWRKALLFSSLRLKSPPSYPRERCTALPDVFVSKLFGYRRYIKLGWWNDPPSPPQGINVWCNP